MSQPIIRATLLALSLFALAFFLPRIVTSPALTTSQAESRDITISAKGTTGNEIIALSVNGKEVLQWKLITEKTLLTYQSDKRVEVEDISVAFLNDRWDPQNGIDYNVIIDYVTVGGVRYESEDANTHSSGTWKRGSGCAPGYKQSEWLQCNGAFTYAVQPGTVIGAPTTVTPPEEEIVEFTGMIKEVIHHPASAR